GYPSWNSSQIQLSTSQVTTTSPSIASFVIASSATAPAVSTSFATTGTPSSIFSQIQLTSKQGTATTLSSASFTISSSTIPPLMSSIAST
ncbi:hypothetical protein ACJMK2_028540, partial [Sinanodonta woodiana]